MSTYKRSPDELDWHVQDHDTTLDFDTWLQNATESQASWSHQLIDESEPTTPSDHDDKVESGWTSASPSQFGEGWNNSWMRRQMATTTIGSMGSAEDTETVANGLVLGRETMNQPPNEREFVCYGMVSRLAIKLESDKSKIIDKLTTLSSSSQSAELDTQLKNGVFYLVFEDKSKFGLLSTTITKFLIDLAQAGSGEIQCQAAINIAAVFRSIRAAKDWKDVRIRADLYFYGPERRSRFVGESLTRAKLFLQRPENHKKGVPYSNPHFLSFADLAPELASLNANEVTVDPEYSGERLGEIVQRVYAGLERAKDLGQTSGPSAIRTPLLDHQKQALYFLLQRENGPIPGQFRLWDKSQDDDPNHFVHKITKRRVHHDIDETGGGILADEMGMGKTLSMLALIVMSANEARTWAAEPKLGDNLDVVAVSSAATLVIVSSPSLIDEWEHEMKTHLCTTLNVVVYHGTKRPNNVNELAYADLVITTYHTVSIEFRKLRSVIHRVKWFRIILDEAHIIRRQDTSFHRAMHGLDAKYRWCLTGTPIQNRLDDIGALVRFLRISPFDRAAEFRRSITAPFNGGPQRKAVAIRNLGLLLDAICLRRNQSLLEIPRRTETIRHLSFTDEERTQYLAIKTGMNRKLREVHSTEFAESRFGLFHVQLQLRIFCNHGTFQDALSWAWTSHRDMEEERLNLASNHAEVRCLACRQLMPVRAVHGRQDSKLWKCGHSICEECFAAGDNALEMVQFDVRVCPVCDTRRKKKKVAGSNNWGHADETGRQFRLNGTSSKMTELINDLKMEIRTTKSIVFTGWTSTLDLCEIHLKRANIAFERIDGGCSRQLRKSILSKMANDDNVRVLIMTTGTGAFGLNLTFANRIFLIEPLWNPAVESQAIARAERLGQTSSVQVIRYIINDSIENEMATQQRGKRELAALGANSREQ